MAYKFSEIRNLFGKFSIDALNIASGEKELQPSYVGYFGDSQREIYVKVVKNIVETKSFIQLPEQHEYGFGTGDNNELFRYFLPKEAIDSLTSDIVSADDTEFRIRELCWEIGKFSDTDDFLNFKVGTLTGFSKLEGSQKLTLDGITDDGEEIHGHFFRPLIKGEKLTINGVVIPVPYLNITPIPPLPREEVNKAIDNFDKEVEKYNELIPGKKKFLDKIEEDLRKGSKALLALHANPVDVKYAVYKDKLIKYTGDFKYEEQIKDILEIFDWDLVAVMARIKLRDLNSNKGNYPLSDLISMLKDNAESTLKDLLKTGLGRLSSGFFTSHNDGGRLSLDFTPESCEGSVKYEFKTEETELDKIKF